MNKTIFTVLGALALFGCGGGGGNGGGGSSSRTRVAYVNASPDAPRLDFLRDGSSAKSGVAYGEASEFSAVAATDADFSVRASDDAQDLWSETATFEADSSNLVVAVGLRTPPTDDTVTPPAPNLLKRLVLSFGAVDRIAPPSGRARIIVLNALVRQAGFPTPPIDFRDPATPSAISAGNLAFGAFSVQNVNAGVQAVQVRQTNTSQIFATSSLTLESGRVYLALVSGLEGAPDPALAPQIRLIPL